MVKWIKIMYLTNYMPSKKFFKKAEPKIEDIDEEDSTNDYDNDADDEDDNCSFLKDDFLEELNNDKYKDPEDIKKEQKIADDKKKAAEKEQKTIEKMKSSSMKLKLNQLKLDSVKSKRPKFASRPEEKDGLYSECPTEILGLDRRQLLARITQTKALFPEKLKSFKIKKNPTIEELQQYVEECDAIISTDCVEGFVTDSIVQCIRIIEGVSSKTKFNVTGMADMLKDNSQFHCLCKQLYLKHKIFANVPPEYQLIMLVSTTALICQQKNKQLSNMEIYLNGIPP